MGPGNLTALALVAAPILDFLGAVSGNWRSRKDATRVGHFEIEGNIDHRRKSCIPLLRELRKILRSLDTAANLC